MSDLVYNIMGTNFKIINTELDDFKDKKNINYIFIYNNSQNIIYKFFTDYMY